MDKLKQKSIEAIVESSISSFSIGLEEKYTKELDDPDGVINREKNNPFIAELGEEFMFYSAFVRSFDSSFGKILENIGNNIAKLSYDVRKNVKSYLLPQQSQHVDYMISGYEKHTKPKVTDYNSFNCMIPQDTRSFEKDHVTDHYFYKKDTKEHFLIELKAGGDLDNKKAKTEKIALLQEYFILKNSLEENSQDTIKIFLATAYNSFGEGNIWKQDRVKQFFAEEELLIGRDYWNFVCDDKDGFDIVFKQYQKSCQHIKLSLVRIKKLYFNDKK
ncbi:TdeIII family type II restriction endonuclease [Mesomycoplasma ovipneumoniae]|uniref:TdeIII family type II restriction endonuclease n=1 Tax=Mesomycoplasma ovipneumoniae TaxID=29562 RepID=UPI00083E7A10|nr:TdeIII family type II restriction endonuclease [Mesomycoplasma ovipneumoniae]WDV48642.1 TdeIII family type II restriction endonuclease [Mesomycoplasma ovipneumoniae ATCC 29419]